MAKKIEKTKTVDFIPEYGISGDFKKVTEYNFMNYNARLIPILVICLMDKGCNQLIPDMGLKDTILGLPFSDKHEAENIIREMQNQFSQYALINVNVYINDEKSDWEKGDITLSLDVDGVPGTVSLGVSKQSSNLYQPFNIQHPSIFT